MAEIIFTVFLFIAITAVTAVLFGGWVIFGIFRFIFRAFTVALGGGSGHYRPFRIGNAALRACVNPRCKGTNPPDARFCRRCGQQLPEAQRVSVRRAAMW